MGRVGMRVCNCIPHGGSASDCKIFTQDRIHWIYEFICACNLVMRDSWIDEVHMSASWLCSLLLSHLLSLGSSDRSHNAFFIIRKSGTSQVKI